MNNNEVINKETLRRLRDASISPYIAQNWEVKADFPKERRITLTREKDVNGFVFVILLFFYIFPAIIYLLYKLIVKEEKTLLY